MPNAALNPDGVSVKGCSIIYAPRGQAGEYSPLATNPYRGCGHKCAYCLTGDTLVQMSDGSSRPISDVEVGSSIIGVTQDRTKRSWGTRLTTTTILAKLNVGGKRAYRIGLEDGTTVTCSADHRWLTERGWKFTASALKIIRPALTTNNLIRKVGGAILTPPESHSYRVGYIAGMVEGDGSIGIYDYSDRRRPSGKTMGIQHRFRLALKDIVGLHRTQHYLALEGIQTNYDDFSAATETRAAVDAIQTTSPARVAKIKSLLVPLDDSEWLRGWLAGIFDAEGSHGQEALRIHNTDEAILAMTERAFDAFGFVTVRDRTQPNQAVRITGGQEEELRFWQLCNPAISRKFSLDGSAVCSSVRVTSIEPLGADIEMFDITTGTENFIANGMVSHNCYVPNVLRMERQEFDAGAIPRPNFLRQLQKEAEKYRALGITEQVMLSFTTDPYHPGDTTLTRLTLEILQAHGLGVCTLTKGGHRALRDIGIFRPVRDAFASTLTSLDPEFSLKWERGATLPIDRIKTLEAFHDAGIFTWVSLEPVLDTAATLEIIRRTHKFVDLFKIGRVNYVGLTKTTDWKQFTADVLRVLEETGAKHYIKKDLQPYLPEGYRNVLRVDQFRAEPFPIL